MALAEFTDQRPPSTSGLGKPSTANQAGHPARYTPYLSILPGLPSSASRLVRVWARLVNALLLVPCRLPRRSRPSPFPLFLLPFHDDSGSISQSIITRIARAEFIRRVLSDITPAQIGVHIATFKNQRAYDHNHDQRPSSLFRSRFLP